MLIIEQDPCLAGETPRILNPPCPHRYTFDTIVLGLRSWFESRSTWPARFLSKRAQEPAHLVVNTLIHFFDTQVHVDPRAGHIETLLLLQ